MPASLVQFIVIASLLIALFGLWGGVHVLARRRLGDRKLGCRGPTTDDWGNTVCCHTGEPCERIKDGACSGEDHAHSCE